MKTVLILLTLGLSSAPLLAQECSSQTVTPTCTAGMVYDADAKACVKITS